MLLSQLPTWRLSPMITFFCIFLFLFGYFILVKQGNKYEWDRSDGWCFVGAVSFTGGLVGLLVLLFIFFKEHFI
jgi:hypothetical protein